MMRANSDTELPAIPNELTLSLIAINDISSKNELEDAALQCNSYYPDFSMELYERHIARLTNNMCRFYSLRTKVSFELFKKGV